MASYVPVTLDEARLRAHEQAMRTDAVYRANYESWCAAREAAKAAQRARPRGAVGCDVDPLLRCRAIVFGLTRRQRVDVDFEAEIRERVLEELRPGVFACWSDPLEWVGVR